MLSIFTARIFPAAPGSPVRGETAPGGALPGAEDEAGGVPDGAATGFLWLVLQLTVSESAAAQQASAATARVRGLWRVFAGRMGRFSSP
jgi:hypothetical protein